MRHSVGRVRSGVAAALTCIDFGRRGRRGDEGGDPSGVEADPESRERSPRMEPRSFPFLVGESTAETKALSCLKLRSCLSSRGADPNGEPGVESGVPAKTEKTNLECGMVIEPERQRRGASRPSRPVPPQQHRWGQGW
jgi:hypothetical protein